MTQPPITNISNPFSKINIPTFGWKRRILLYLQALCCMNQRIKGWDGSGKLQYTGWFNCRTGVTYITWMRK